MLRAFRIRTLQNRINIGNLCRLRNAVCGPFSEGVCLHIETTITVFGIRFELRANPLAGGANTASGGNGGGILRGKSRARSETHQLFDIASNSFGGDFLQGRDNLWVDDRLRGSLLCMPRCGVKQSHREGQHRHQSCVRKWRRGSFFQHAHPRRPAWGGRPTCAARPDLEAGRT